MHRAAFAFLRNLDDRQCSPKGQQRAHPLLHVAAARDWSLTGSRRNHGRPGERCGGAGAQLADMPHPARVLSCAFFGAHGLLTGGSPPSSPSSSRSSPDPPRFRTFPWSNLPQPATLVCGRATWFLSHLNERAALAHQGRDSVPAPDAETACSMKSAQSMIWQDKHRCCPHPVIAEQQFR